MAGEVPEARARRVRQRALFDGVADLYDETRVGYPSEVINDLFRIAGLDAGDRVLEVGCGTVDLAHRRVDLTAIDLGPAMVAATRAKVSELGVVVDNCAFEDFDAGVDKFAAVVAATAFHWIDPEIGWKKSAALLPPEGWIAILATAERYDEPVGEAFREQWIRYSTDGGAWATTPRTTLADTIASTALFHDAVTTTHLERRSITPDMLVRLEQTRATALSYDAATRKRFFADLRDLLEGLDEVPLTQETTLTMAQLK